VSKKDADVLAWLQGQREGVSDAHQSHFAECDGEPPRAPVAIRSRSAEEDHPTTWQPEAGVMSHKGSFVQPLPFGVFVRPGAH